MQAGEFNEPLNLLSLQKTDNVYSWASGATVWAKVEEQPQKNLFSAIGVGAKGVKITIRKREITLSNAFSWNGQHCFLTDITESQHMYYVIQAALVEPKTCVLMKNTNGKDSLKRPVETVPQPVLTFPACLVEKYQGFQIVNPQSRVISQFVLVTPKEISLVLGDFVEIDSIDYNVQIVHDLDEFKNEYEIAVNKEA